MRRMQRSGRAPMFYGWVIVAVALVMNLASSPATAVTFGFFIRPMSSDLGWSESELVLGLTFRLAVAGITSPFLGLLLDRVGSRILGTVAALVAGGSIMAVGLVDQLWLFYLLYAISGLSGFGSPSGQLLTVVPVAKWFHLKRGRALSIAMAGTPAGNLLLIPVAQLLIDLWGWRTAWMVLGAILVLGAAPICALLMRKDPESLGLNVDGLEAPSPAAEKSDVVIDDGSWNVREVTHSYVFWLLLFSTAAAGIVTQGTLVNRVPFWQDTGIDSGYVALGTALAPLLVVLSGLVCGVLADRFAIRMIGFGGAAIAGLSAVPMVFARDSILLLAVHNILWGIGQGANNTVANVVWPAYFGRRFLGAIRGVIFPVAIGTAALSAPLFAVLLAQLSEPRLAWLVTVAGFGLSGLLFLVAKPPRRREVEGSEDREAITA
jgi:sugar phosphate permease